MGTLGALCLLDWLWNVDVRAAQGCSCKARYARLSRETETMLDAGRTRAARRTKIFVFSLGTNLGGFGVLKNREKSSFEIMGQAGGFPTTYPNGPLGQWGFL